MHLAWGLYNAYYAIVSHGVLRQQILQHGLPSKLIMDESVKRLVITVFPYMKSLIENLDVSALHEFLDDIEKELLKELRSIIAGENEDEKNMERASKIIRASEDLIRAGYGASANDQVLTGRCNQGYLLAIECKLTSDFSAGSIVKNPDLARLAA